MKSYVALLSAGLDSTVNLYQAQKQGQVILALTFDYGQKAAKKEKERAKKICDSLGVSHQVVELPWFTDFSKSSLTHPDKNVPIDQEVSIDDLEVSTQTAQSVWVPNRNGIFFNIAAAYAEGLGADAVLTGFNLEEAQTFPDNTEEYLQALTKSFFYSTATHIVAESFTTHMNKTEIVKMGREIGVNFDQIWPCYFSGDEICGKCESCLRFQRALKA